MENFKDNELRNLYRKNGEYKVIKTLNNKTHVFAIFKDIEKAIFYRDLFEDNNWNMILKGITDINNSPIKTTNIIKSTINTEINNEPEIIEETTPEVKPIKEEPSHSPEDNNSKEKLKTNKKIISDEPIKEEPLTTSNNDESFEEFDDKYIYFDKKKGYKIIKNMDGKNESFGVYDTLDEAITARDYFREHNWDLNEKSKFNSTTPLKDRPKRYIYQVKDFYQIKKRIKSKTITFGQYKTLEDAITARDYFESHGWNQEDISKFYNKRNTKYHKNPKRYIRTNKYGYSIHKNGVHWGSFSTLEEAVTARDFLEEHDFSLEYKDKYSKKKPVSDNYFENTSLF